MRSARPRSGEPGSQPHRDRGSEAGASAIKRLLGRGSIYTVGTALEAAGVALMLPILTRLLAPAEFGVVATALVVASIVAMLAPLGITTAIMRFHYEGAEGPNRTRALVLWSPLLALGVAALLEVTGPTWAEAVAGVEYTDPLRLAVWSALPTAAMLGAQAALIAQDRPARYISVAIVSTVGAQGLGVLLVWAADLGVTGYMGGLLIARTAAAVVGIASAGVRLRSLADMPLLSSAMKLGLPTVPHSVAMYLLNAGDRLIVGKIEGLAAVGRYQVAYVIGSLGMVLLFSFNQAWAPLIYGAEPEARWETLSRTADAVYRLAAWVAGLLAVLSPVALLVAAPSEYDRPELVPVCSIVALSVVPFVTYLRHVLIVFQVQRTGTLAWAAPVATAFNFALNFALVPVIGLTGAALSTLGAVVVLGELLRASTRRLASVPWTPRSEVRAWAIGGSLVLASLALPASGAWLAARLGLSVALALTLAREIRQFLVR